MWPVPLIITCSRARALACPVCTADAAGTRNTSLPMPGPLGGRWAPGPGEPRSSLWRARDTSCYCSFPPFEHGSHGVACALVQELLPPGSHTGFSGLHLPFIGFTFTTERWVRSAAPQASLPSGEVAGGGRGPGRGGCSVCPRQPCPKGAAGRFVLEKGHLVRMRSDT